MYIVFEWVVWVGKTTQSKNLADRLQKKFPAREVVWIREPGSSEIAESIRNLVQAQKFDETMLPITDVYLYASARAQLLHWKVKTILSWWWIIVSDRSFITSLAYQWHAQWFWIDRVWEVNKLAVQGIIPDIVLFLDLDVHEWYARTFDAAWDKRERQPVDFFEKIYEWFQIIKKNDQYKGIRNDIDASWSVDEVQTRIISIIENEIV